METLLETVVWAMRGCFMFDWDWERSVSKSIASTLCWNISRGVLGFCRVATAAVDALVAVEPLNGISELASVLTEVTEVADVVTSHCFVITGFAKTL